MKPSLWFRWLRVGFAWLAKIIIPFPCLKKCPIGNPALVLDPFIWSDIESVHPTLCSHQNSRDLWTFIRPTIDSNLVRLSIYCYFIGSLIHPPCKITSWQSHGPGGPTMGSHVIFTRVAQVGGGSPLHHLFQMMFDIV